MNLMQRLSNKGVGIMMSIASFIRTFKIRTFCFVLNLKISNHSKKVQIARGVSRIGNLSEPKFFFTKLVTGVLNMIRLNALKTIHFDYKISYVMCVLSVAEN